MITNTDYVSSWRSKGLSAENIKLPTTSNNSRTPAVSYYGTKTKVKFTGSCLKQPNISYTHGKVVSIYIAFRSKIIKHLKKHVILKNRNF